MGLPWKHGELCTFAGCRNHRHNAKAVMPVLKEEHPTEEGIREERSAHFEKCFGQTVEREAFVVYPCGILIKSWHRDFLKTPGNCISFWKKKRKDMMCGQTSADSQPTKLRGAFFWLSALFEGEEGITSLETGNRVSCCLIITVISFWIWGVAVKKNKHKSEKIIITMMTFSPWVLEKSLVLA